MKRQNSSLLGFYTIGIAALFLAGFFLLVIFGAQSYRDTVSGQYGNAENRTLLSYLSTTVKGYDSAGAVRVVDGEDGPVLCLEDGNTGYALRVYRNGTQLMEDYAADGAALSNEDAQVIGETSTFEIEWPKDDLMRISTDAGEVLIRVRCGGGS